MMMSAVPDSFPWPMASFAQSLRDLRNACRLTQTRIAELLQVSPRVYRRWDTCDVTSHFDYCPDRRVAQKVDLLSDEDQKAPLAVLDNLAKRSSMRRVMTE